jgi:HEAT repeat protein
MAAAKIAKPLKRVRGKRKPPGLVQMCLLMSTRTPWLVVTLLTILSSVHLSGQDSPGASDELVRRLGQFTAGFPAGARSDGRPDPVEERRRSVYGELLALGEQAQPALVRGLADPDVQVRRNVALFLDAAGGAWSNVPQPPLNLEPFLNGLVSALQDEDARVRQLAAQAIGEIGPKAVSAVPTLIALLADSDEGSRDNACLALGGIGPVAKDALPALRAALLDPSASVRRFAQRAIERIDIRR